MKRLLLLSMIILPALLAKAQTPMQFGAMNPLQPGFSQRNWSADTSVVNKKWFITKYAGLSAGLMSFKGGSSSFYSVPLGAQLNRQLTNNLVAFAGVTVAPSYFPSFNTFYQPGFDKNRNFMNPNRFSTYGTAQMGLMYINNERTFSISGSFGVGRDFNNYRSSSFNPAYSPALRNFKQ